MKDLLFYLVQNIALEPKKVRIDEEEQEGQITFSITCDKDDIGRVIGKQGKVIKALRRILGIIAVHEGKRVNLSIAQEQ